MAGTDRQVNQMDIICILDVNVTIKSHPTDNSKVILTVAGTDYVVDGGNVIAAVNAAMTF